MTISRLSAAALLLLAAVLPPAFPAAAQQGGGNRQEARGAPQQDGRKLPADATTEHVLELPGRTLRFAATAGALPLVDPSGTVQAEIGFTAYRLLGQDAATRPVTFAVNGGPGASSAYLHLLVAGPWHLPVPPGPISPSQPIALQPNPETWLDFTDLVFLDPVGTGYSRASGSDGEVRERYYTVDGDVASLSAAIARWLRENDRLPSPKYVLGESYGGFRGPLLAAKLRSDTGVALSGMVLLSPVLDFGWLSQPRWKPMESVVRLPSLAATARERGGAGALSRGDLRDAEAYADTDYLLDLLRGPGDRAAQDRIVERVSALTGLGRDLVRRREGRLDLGTVGREIGRPEGRVASIYDTGVSGLDPDPGAPDSEADDAVLDALRAPLAGAAVDLLWRRLNWRVPNARYELLNGPVSGQWRYGRGRRPAESFSALRKDLASDERLHVLVAHGLTDLVTPYFASALLLRQLEPAIAARARLETFPGGHMFYTRQASRAAFRDSARALYEATKPGN